MNEKLIILIVCLLSVIKPNSGQTSDAAVSLQNTLSISLFYERSSKALLCQLFCIKIYTIVYHNNMYSTEVED